MPSYQIIYTPRIEDEVVVAEFSTLKEAELHMNKIKEESLDAYPAIFYHDEQAWIASDKDSKRVGEILQESFREAPKWFGVECMDGGDYVIGNSYAEVH